MSLVHLESAELGTAQWEFGYSTYAFLDDDRIALLAQKGGSHQLYIWNRDRPEVRAVELPYTSMKPYLSAQSSQVAIIGSSPDRLPVTAVADLGSGTVREVTVAAGVAPGRQPPDPEVIDIPARDGGRVYATLHRPGPGNGNTAVPVIVRAHPGPTSNAPLRLDAWVQFFLGRGFAVLDVDYRGSTGYGRAYRNALRRSLLRPGITAHCPVLAFHGSQDTITPLHQVRDLVAALGRRASLVTYPDEGHGLSRPGNIEHAIFAELAHYRAALAS